MFPFNRKGRTINTISCFLLYSLHNSGSFCPTESVALEWINIFQRLAHLTQAYSFLLLFLKATWRLWCCCLLSFFVLFLRSYLPHGASSFIQYSSVSCEKESTLSSRQVNGGNLCINMCLLYVKCLLLWPQLMGRRSKSMFLSRPVMYSKDVETIQWALLPRQAFLCFTV